MERNTFLPLLFMVFLSLLTVAVLSISLGGSSVIREGEKSYIVDLTGERWDVSQAVTLGFDPRGFQHGIGRNAFTPLDDSLLREGGEDVPGHLRVIGVDDGSAGKAYSVRKLSRHEISNSEMGEEKVAVAYWPLVDLAAVYSREIDGKVLTLVPSGWTYRSTFVLYDRETGSLWYPYKKGLMGIQGEYFKRWLPKVSSRDTTWGNWYRENPESKILK